jgi:5'-nucleotidase
VRILVTNDDGVDAVGLHILARRLVELGDVVVAAPDREYSGASAALGTLHLIRPEVHRVDIAGVPEAWSVTGPPALCVMFARLGVFGAPFDLVVSGINPGANAGRAIYHSGTVGAALTARNGGVSGLAVSQAVDDFGIEGQGSDDMLADQHWDTAAEIGIKVARAMLDDLPVEPIVLNVNVPNVPRAELAGWRRTEVALLPPRGRWRRRSSFPRSATTTPSTCRWSGAIRSCSLVTPTVARWRRATSPSRRCAASSTMHR